MVKKLLLIIFIGTFLFQGRIFDKHSNVIGHFIVEDTRIKSYDRDWKFKKQIRFRDKLIESKEEKHKEEF